MRIGGGNARPHEAPPAPCNVGYILGQRKTRMNNNARPWAWYAGRKDHVMKKITNLKDKLTATCPRPWLWHKPYIDDTGKPVCELGYFRCDNNGGRWWNTVWPVHDALSTPALSSEFDSVLDAFYRSFKDIPAMRKWCVSHAGKTGDFTEYNAYYEGDHGFYWFRMITRRGDYNLYLHCYSKAAMPSHAMYWTTCRETGDRIDVFDTYDAAEAEIARYEENDKLEGNYTPDFYEIELDFEYDAPYAQEGGSHEVQQIP